MKSQQYSIITKSSLKSEKLILVLSKDVFYGRVIKELIISFVTLAYKQLKHLTNFMETQPLSKSLGKTMINSEIINLNPVDSMLLFHSAGEQKPNEIEIRHLNWLSKG